MTTVTPTTGHTPHSPIIYPQGTQVVTRQPIRSATTDNPQGRVVPQGSVAVIQEYIPEVTAYLVKWVADGTIDTLLASEIFIRKHAAATRLEEVLGQAVSLNHDFMQKHALYSCLVGSQAFGLDTPTSDVDIRGVYQLGADAYRSLTDPPKIVQREDNNVEEELWELRHFLEMALKANPNIIESLYSPMSFCYNDLGRELLENRSRLLSRRVYETYSGYVASQYRKIEQDLRTKGEVKRKHAMHLIRLLLSGIHLVRDGFPLIDVGSYKDILLSIKDGQMPWDQVLSLRKLLNAEFEEAFATTKLALDPDYAWANDFLIRARKSLDK